MIQIVSQPLSLVHFSRILRIPYIGQSVFTTEWGLDSLSAYQEPDGPYHTELPTPDDIHQYIKFERTDSNRLIKGQIVNLTPYRILTKEVKGEFLPERLARV
ncbi:hypothetical protein Tco_1066540 [Tanacetum coccineum]|uniref:Uncharacterized protein n=1 Tax=Tanacetum coccineum TaxID=301880 RepID=A0ABQ5HAS2_9ASTR